MRILVISFFNDWVTHLGVELEIAHKHLDAGDQVEFLGCDGCIRICQANPSGSATACEICRYRRLRGIQLLSAPVTEHRLGDYTDAAQEEEVERLAAGVNTAEAARAFKFEGEDLGWGALSSTIQELRDPLCKTDQAKTLLAEYTKTALTSYLAVKHFLRRHPPFDVVYIFNGRFACTRGAFRACQKTGGMKIMLHERGCSIEKYDVFENDLPHAREFWIRRIQSMWEKEGNQQEREQIGRSFYEERRAGVAVAWHSFTNRQESGLLPEDWDASRKNIVIYNSSEDEFAGIGDEWKNPVYPMQCDGVRRIVSDGLIQCPEVHFYLRMHPNLTGVENEDVRILRSIQSPNFTLIEPDAKICTYALLDAADKAISFGSTVGIEATYWRKPSISAGHSFYEDLDAVYWADSHETLMNHISLDLEPKPLLGALKYGFCMRTFGTEFKYWKATEMEHGTFKGANLKHHGRRIERKIILPLSRFLLDHPLLMRGANLVFDSYDSIRRKF